MIRVAPPCARAQRAPLPDQLTRVAYYLGHTELPDRYAQSADYTLQPPKDLLDHPVRPVHHSVEHNGVPRRRTFCADTECSRWSSRRSQSLLLWLCRYPGVVHLRHKASSINFLSRVFRVFSEPCNDCSPGVRLGLTLFGASGRATGSSAFVPPPPAGLMSSATR